MCEYKRKNGLITDINTKSTQYTSNFHSRQSFIPFQRVNHDRPLQSCFQHIKYTNIQHRMCHKEVHRFDDIIDDKKIAIHSLCVTYTVNRFLLAHRQTEIWNALQTNYTGNFSGRLSVLFQPLQAILYDYSIKRVNTRPACSWQIKSVPGETPQSHTMTKNWAASHSRRAQYSTRHGNWNKKTVSCYSAK